MKQFYRLVSLLIACCTYFGSSAQTSCSADFSYSVGANKLVSFVSKDTVGGSHRWTFGDGSSATTTAGATSHQYASPGQYEVKHVVEKPNISCRDTLVKHITIAANDTCVIKALFTHWQDSIDCKKVYFVNASSPVSAKTHFIWSFGDGSSSKDITPSHTYSQPGKYYVCLVSESDSGCRAQYCDSLIVNCDAPACNIINKYEWKKDSSNCNRIYFINRSAPVAANTHFTWKFGDGTSSTDVNPTHIYTQSGKYYVCLVSETGANCRKEYCDSITVKCETACTLVSKYEWKKDSSDCRRIIFFNRATPVTANTKFAWKFGDGGGSYDANPSYTYAQPGRYLVCLVVDNGNGCSKSYCDSINVICETNTCTIVNRYEWKKDSSNCKRIIFFNRSAPISSGTHFSWKFGDGTSSTDVNPTHTYAQNGRYAVCLVSETGSNCRKEYCDSVTVSCTTTPSTTDSCAGKAQFTHTTYPAAPLAIGFTASYQTSSVKYYWNFGDGTTADSKSVYHSFPKAGRYLVCLTITDGNCKTTRCDSISAGAGCDYVTLKYEYSAKATQPNEISFKTVSNEPVLSQIWTIFKGQSVNTGGVPLVTLQENNPTYLFRDTGWYRVCVKTITSSMCAKEYCGQVYIGKVVNGGRDAIVIAPNPAINTISLDVTLDRAEQVSIKIIDGSGTVKLTFSKYGVAGGNRFTLPVGDLKPGIYLVLVQTSTKVLISRFVKG